MHSSRAGSQEFSTLPSLCASERRGVCSRLSHYHRPCTEEERPPEGAWWRLSRRGWGDADGEEGPSSGAGAAPQAQPCHASTMGAVATCRKGCVSKAAVGGLTGSPLLGVLRSLPCVPCWLRPAPSDAVVLCAKSSLPGQLLAPCSVAVRAGALEAVWNLGRDPGEKGRKMSHKNSRKKEG